MKLIKEHINEKFTQDSDPITDMGIGLHLRIPYGYVKNVSNKLYKRFKTIEPSDEYNDWKVVHIYPEGDIFNVTLEQKTVNYISTSNVFLTRQQIELFAKKYQNKSKY